MFLVVAILYPFFLLS